MDVKSSFDSDPNQIDQICVAIRSYTANQRHAGILYRDSSDSIKLLHLGWHYDLGNDDFSNDFLWLDVPLNPINKMHMATVCEMFYEENKDGIPYGLAIDDSFIDQQGKFLPMEAHAGLTCATFVMKLFHDQGLAFIDIDGWKHRLDDKTWQRQVMQILEHHTTDPKPSKEYLDYQNKRLNSGCARFRPEEIIAARHLPDFPYCAESVKEPAVELVSKVDEHFKKIKEQKHLNWLKEKGRQSSQVSSNNT